jgi:hypothetical protein
MHTSIQVDITTLTIHINHMIHYYNDADDLLQGILIHTGKNQFEINNITTLANYAPRTLLSYEEMFPRAPQEMFTSLEEIIPNNDQPNIYQENYENNYDNNYEENYEDDYEEYIEYEDIKICLSKEQFENLHHTQIDFNMLHDKSCIICLDNFKLNEIITVLHCSHIFHKQCAESWFCNNSTNCPICRRTQKLNFN